MAVYRGGGGGGGGGALPRGAAHVLPVYKENMLTELFMFWLVILEWQLLHSISKDTYNL